MPACCRPTRRQVLRWASVVAATPLLTVLDDEERAYGVTVPGDVLPHNLELVTLTETSAVLTWFTGDPSRPDSLGRLAPAPADTEVRLGTSPARLRAVHSDSRRTPYHYVELTGLEPGRTYFYRAFSDGLPAVPSAFSAGNPVGTSGPSTLSATPFTFTTPQPPPGRFLFAVALCNDMHLGETVAGLATSVGGVGLPPGVAQEPGEPPYAELMSRALVAEAGRRRSDLLLAAGDLTAEARPAEVRAARRLLDEFGALDRDYLVVRGNHDRPHEGDEWDSCAARPGTDGRDCFRDDFFPAGGPTWFAHEAYGLRILGLDTYDKPGGGGDTGALSAEQFAFLRSALRDDPDRPTLVFGHHPVTADSSVTTAPPVVFNLDQRQARRVEELYADAPGVFLHHCAHTHRNKRTRARRAPGVVFQEVGATKEYPGGFHLLRVHSGGYALNFHRFRDRAAREWVERTRQEYVGGYPYYTFGTVRDRNSVEARDFSGLRPARTRHPDEGRRGAGHRDGGRSLPATGGALHLAAAGAVVTSAAVTAGLRAAHRA